MNTNTQTPKRLTRKQITEGLDTVPVSALLTGGSRKELTARQAKFAREVALGSTKADAYRKSYKAGSPHTLSRAPYILARDERIKQEIEAIKRAVEAEHIKSPAALRALVIQTLVEVATNPDAKDATRLQAVKILGTVTEIAAFTERKETTVVTSSKDARAEVMAELRALANAHASDAQVVETQAAELLEELKSAAAAPHPSPTTTRAEQESPDLIHTIPLKPTQDFMQPPPIISDATSQRPLTKNYPREDIPTPAFREDPPA
jgi:hypothetical protein